MLHRVLNRSAVRAGLNSPAMAVMGKYSPIFLDTPQLK